MNQIWENGKKIPFGPNSGCQIFFLYKFGVVIL